jgi:hypothetical protein
MSMLKRIILSAILTALCSGIASAAETVLPSYARPSDQESIKGSIAGVTGKYTVRVRDEHGFVDEVQLHQGTVINPTGATLAEGMQVTVYGHTRGNVFAANEIDTPYRAVTYAVPPYGPYPYPVGPFGPPWGYYRYWR